MDGEANGGLLPILRGTGVRRRERVMASVHRRIEKKADDATGTFSNGIRGP